MKKRSKTKRCLFTATAALIGLAASEVALSLLAAVSPRVAFYLRPPWDRYAVVDSKLGQRPSPYYPGNDAWGFRNAAVPESCDILAIGDSMTFGYSAPPDAAWPRRLAEKTHKTVYNMSFGGYGPCEYNELLGRGLTLSPEVVVVAVYLGNDLTDCYEAVWVDDRFPRFRSQDAAVLDAMRKADAAGTLSELASRYQGLSHARGSGSIKSWISEHSALYGVARGLLFALDPDRYKSPFRDKALARDQFDVARLRFDRVAVEGEGRTVFMPPRALMLRTNLEDPRIRQGLRIAQAAIAEMKPKTKRFLVALLPSKFVVYKQRLSTKTMRDLVAAEEDVARQLRAFLTEQGIDFVDTTDALRKALSSGKKPYPESDDEHTNAAGYAAIAAAIAEHLR